MCEYNCVSTKEKQTQEEREREYLCVVKMDYILDIIPITVKELIIL